MVFRTKTQVCEKVKFQQTESLKKTPLWAMAKGRPGGLQGLATMNEEGKHVLSYGLQPRRSHRRRNERQFPNPPPISRPQKPRKRLLRGFLGRFILSGSIYGDANCSVLCHA